MVKINPDKYFKDMFARTEGYAGNVQQIYAGAITQLTELAIAFKPKEGETFSFDANEKMKGKATNILRTMNAKVYGAIQGGVKAEWTQSNIKNDKLVAAIFGKDAFEKNHFARYFDRNEKAMKAFMDRSKKEGGLGLSQKVWNYTGQLKAELEVALDLGIGEGGSAAHISKAVRSYLKEPDKLFKRVQITTKDAEGNITKTGRYKLSKAAKMYNPGQGDYRSSYKNAMRLTRTETNMAYLTADYERWQQFDFVVGYEVKLSSNHPVTDICNDFAGKYPKTFKFVGWHPQCRCFVIAILCTDKELDTLTDAILKGEDMPIVSSINEVKRVPNSFIEWIEANKSRVATALSIPYFIRDNFVEGDITKGLSLAKPAVVSPTVVAPPVVVTVPPVVVSTDKYTQNLIDTSNKIGVALGDEMTFEDANELKGNINFDKNINYKVNCQACVVSNELRRRGFDVTALPNLKTAGNIPYQLSRRTEMAWIDPTTGLYPDKKVVGRGIRKVSTLSNELAQAMAETGRYDINFVWKGTRSGHIITVEKFQNGKFRFYDPQNGKIVDWNNLSARISPKYGISVLRVDNLLINNDLIKGVVTKL